jgi:hypothetical protein
MKLTFRSHEFEREIAIEEIYEMPLEDARRFHLELTLAIQSMDDSIGEANRLEVDAGVRFDRDWMHKARKKRRITVAFASEAKRRVMKLEGFEPARRQSIVDAQRAKFQTMRHDKLRELLKEELGPGVLEEIECEAHEVAEGMLKAWLAENGHEQIYIT